MLKPINEERELSPFYVSARSLRIWRRKKKWLQRDTAEHFHLTQRHYRRLEKVGTRNKKIVREVTGH